MASARDYTDDDASQDDLSQSQDASDSDSVGEGPSRGHFPQRQVITNPESRDDDDDNDNAKEVFDLDTEQKAAKIASEQDQEILSLYHRAQEKGLKPDPSKLTRRKTMHRPRPAPRKQPIFQIPIGWLQKRIQRHVGNAIYLQDRKLHNYKDIVIGEPQSQTRPVQKSEWEVLGRDHTASS
ncbi:hypothetical protein PFICI_10877 [Pestalotiopsis fici W106-1]|uniref:Uncharacterized protein n=1 Tax=Pestalotiopsis fici (strain W106-1 / CGMCC3.15140) TaxID=1229662 RepID=W3WSZ9_PESFW|nr:uncharacterized protein PFICI_10877 [Pestalotiopsis fici W106-1]ETS77003.1 hypothetical protein PFICI_10877 [Pestalotiopsis fici W106-1]